MKTIGVHLFNLCLYHGEFGCLLKLFLAYSNIDMLGSLVEVEKVMNVFHFKGRTITPNQLVLFYTKGSLHIKKGGNKKRCQRYKIDFNLLKI